MTEPTTLARPSGRRRPLARIATGLAIATLAIGISAAPAFAADPTRTTTVPARTSGVPTQTQGSTAEATRTVDLSRSTAHVLQYTNYWCVPAATQTMLNLVTGASDRSRSTQQRLYNELQKANLYDYSTNGNDVRGWSRVLTARLPAGQGYADVAYTSRTTAYEAIVEAMDRTKRPVGIVVDAGRHAWTVVGFSVRETTGVGGARTILGFIVVGPLGSPSDPWPQRYLTVDELSTRFTRYHEWQRPVPWEDKYVIVAPVWTTGAVAVSR